MKLTGESKVLLGIVFFTVLVIGIAAVVMTKPTPTLLKSDLILQNTHVKGSPQAKTYLVEFSDFQCPACLAAKPTVDAILKKYPDTLFFAYRHFPLDQHPFGRKAALAAEAAAKQGKFWEMYDLLFANQDKFSDTLFPDLAKQLGLDATKFADDMKATDTVNTVNTDQQAGVTFGVNATPSFFLNGQKLNLGSFDDIAKAVDEAVKNSQ